MWFNILILFSLLYSAVLQAGITMQRFTIHDGLADVIVFSLETDENGYLWVGTMGGLNRYNGYEMDSYYHEPNFSNSLSHNSVSSLLIDANNELWIATWGGGLNRFNPSTGQFKHYLESNVLTSNYIQSIYQDHLGYIWIGSSDEGLQRLNPETSEVIVLPRENLSNSRIWSLAQSGLNTLWIGTADGLNKINLDTLEITTIAKSQQLANTEIRSILTLDTGELLLGTKQGVYHYNPKEDTFTWLKINKGSQEQEYRGVVNTFKIDEVNQVVWVGSEQGLAAIDLNTLDFVKMPYLAEYESFSNIRIRDIEFSDDRMLWLGTRGHGVVRLNLGSIHFQSLATGISTTSILPINEQHYWLGTYQGLYMGNKASPKEFQPILNHHKAFSAIYDLQQDRKKLWVGSVDGVFYSEDKGAHFTPLEELGSAEGRRILIANKKTYIGTNEGLWQFDGKNTSQIILPLTPEQKQNSQFNTIHSLFSDFSGVLWITTEFGEMYRFNPITTDIVRIGKISTTGAFSMAQTDVEHLWVGVNEGILNFNIQTGEYHFVEALDFTQGRAVTSLLADDNGILWLATRNGISSYNPMTEQVSRFGVADGIELIAFSIDANAKDELGNIYFGSHEGVSFFNPNILGLAEKKPEIRLDHLSINHEQRYPQEINNNTYEIELEPEDKFLSFSFSLSDMNFPEFNRYRFQLIGFDGDWIDRGRNRIATYTNLDPGRYVFQVEGANRSGLWSEQSLQVNIRVHPPWWRTWWARMLLIASLIVIATTLYLLRIRQLAKENELLEEKVIERTAELAAVNEKLKEISSQDFLTQLLNRRAFLERVEEEIARISRHYSQFGLALIDIDDFKRINDDYGHDVGDKVLVEIAQKFTLLTRRQDVVARWGGEEFIFLLPNTNMAQAMAAFEKVRRAIEKIRFDIGGINFNITATFGVCEFNPGDDIDESIAQADVALYHGKRSGKNKVVSTDDVEEECEEKIKTMF